MLEAFDITNTQLGDMFAAYGATAMVSYFLGGPFALAAPVGALLIAERGRIAMGARQELNATYETGNASP